MNILKEGLLLSLAPQSMAAIFFWHCALLCYYYQSIARCRATHCLPVLSPLQISLSLACTICEQEHFIQYKVQE